MSQVQQLTCRKSSKEDFNDSLIIEISARAVQAAIVCHANSVLFLLRDAAELGCWKCRKQQPQSVFICFDEV